MNNYRKTLYSNYFTTQIEATVADESWTDRVFSKEILPHLLGYEQKQLVELGCGHGNLIQFLKKSGFQTIIGCDVSEEQVAIAQKQGLPVELEDAQVFLGRRKWDVVIAVDVLEHFTKDEAVELLKEIRINLNPGGRVIVRIPNADAAVGGAFLWSDVTHELFLNAASARQLFQSCGFAEVSVFAGHSQARGWKRFLSVPLRGLIEWKQKWKHLAYGVGTKEKIWTPNLVVVAQL
jgi:2-polyprenyl-3-methyl-5-hydroxy-6-metoxy-1,4-benzoquinol methylase